MILAFKVHAIENTQNIPLFQRALRRIQSPRLRCLASDNNPLMRRPITNCHLVVLAHLPATEVVYFAITHIAGSRYMVNTVVLAVK